VSVRYISTAWNYADIMTKPVGKIQFARILELCKPTAPETRGVRESGEAPDHEIEIAKLIMIRECGERFDTVLPCRGSVNQHR